MEKSHQTQLTSKTSVFCYGNDTIVLGTAQGFATAICVRQLKGRCPMRRLSTHFMGALRWELNLGIAFLASVYTSSTPCREPCVADVCRTNVYHASRCEMQRGLQTCGASMRSALGLSLTMRYRHSQHTVCPASELATTTTCHRRDFSRGIQSTCFRPSRVQLARITDEECSSSTSSQQSQHRRSTWRSTISRRFSSDTARGDRVECLSVGTFDTRKLFFPCRRRVHLCFVRSFRS